MLVSLQDTCAETISFTSLSQDENTHTFTHTVSGEPQAYKLPCVSWSQDSIHSQWTVEILTCAQEDKVSTCECWCPLLLCGCVKWLMQVSNQCFPPQGRQGPQWSDIRLRASAGLIEWYVSGSGCCATPFFVSVFLFLTICALFPLLCLPSSPSICHSPVFSALFTFLFLPLCLFFFNPV